MLQEGSAHPQTELGDVLGVVDASGEEHFQVGDEGGQRAGQFGVQVLVEEDQVDHAVVQH